MRVDTCVQEFPTLPVKTFEEMKSRFSNQRQWRDFVAAVQCSVNYSTVVGTLRSATRFFTGALTRSGNR